MKKAPTKRLTDMEWLRVFDVRCRAKRGEPLSLIDDALIRAAFAEDQERYAAMNDAIFEATKPFGSRIK